MKRSQTWPTFVVCILISVLLAGCVSYGTGSPVVKATEFGLIEGVDDSAASGTYYWLGVPFATPPVTALRWKAPVDPTPWKTTLATKRFGNACVQYGRIYGPGSNNTYDATIGTTLNTAVGSEDCLYLNIWRPATKDTRLPVIVFIYGGSNVSGYTADPVYHGANLARIANAVVVTINYRLGVFGWLNLAQLKSGTNALDDSGNFGTLDNIKALQFIKKNVANFGGDPTNVTLTGQSAGAINVYALMVSPLTQNAGLFQRVAAFSGGISLASQLPPGSIPLLLPVAYYAEQGTQLLYGLLIADGKATDPVSAQGYVATQTNQQIADYMRSKSPSAILALIAPPKIKNPLAGPIPEGTVVPADPVASIAAGKYTKVPFLASNTRDEAKLFPHFLPLLGGGRTSGAALPDATRFAIMVNFNPDGAPALTVADLITPRYLPVTAPTTGYNAETDALNKVFFIPSRDNVLNALKQQQSNIWYYQFDWDEEPAPWNDYYGAAHLFDMPFVFGNFGPSVFANAMNSTANKGGRLALSDAMMKSIGAFARNGDPNNPSLGVTWTTWPAKLIFDASLTEKRISVQ
jgi:para-nitrobenzyl esterase